MPVPSVARLEEHRPGGVAEQHAGRAVLVVQDGGHHVGADDQDLLVQRRSSTNCAPIGEGVDEAGAGGRDVEAPGARRALILSCTRQAVAGKIMSGSRSPTTIRSSPRPPSAARAQASWRPPWRAARSWACPASPRSAALDAGARADPLVVRVHALREVRVRHDPLGHVAPQRRDGGPYLAHFALVSAPTGHARVAAAQHHCSEAAVPNQAGRALRGTVGPCAAADARAAQPVPTPPPHGPDRGRAWCSASPSWSSAGPDRGHGERRGGAAKDSTLGHIQVYAQGRGGRRGGRDLLHRPAEQLPAPPGPASGSSSRAVAEEPRLAAGLSRLMVGALLSSGDEPDGRNPDRDRSRRPRGGVSRAVALREAGTSARVRRACC